MRKVKGTSKCCKAKVIIDNGKYICFMCKKECEASESNSLNWGNKPISPVKSYTRIYSKF